MNRFAQAWARLTGSTSTTALASNDGEQGGDQTITLTRAQADQLDAEYQNDVTAAKAEGIEEGRKAAHDRFTAVLDSEPGRANPVGARTLLSNDKLSAEEILTMLPNLGAGGGEAPEGGDEGGRQSHLAQTPKLNLLPEGGTEANTAAGGAEGEQGSGKKTWASVQKATSNALTEGGLRGAVQAR